MAAEAFFRQALPEKLACRMPRDSGYRPMREEYSRSPDRPDEVESFTVSYRLRPPAALVLSDHAMSLHQRMLAVFDLLEPIAELAIISLAKRFGLANTARFRGALHRSSILQLNYSRPSQIAVNYINEVHEDGCLLTITSVTAPGLELERRDGTFLPLAPMGREFLVMSGEILTLLTGGAVPTVFHRVQPARAYVERMSLLFFADLCPEQCDPWIVNETNSGVDIGQRVLKNSARFGLAEWDKDQFS